MSHDINLVSAPSAHSHHNYKTFRCAFNKLSAVYCHFCSIMRQQNKKGEDEQKKTENSWRPSAGASPLIENLWRRNADDRLCMQNVTSQLTEQQKWRHFAFASLEVISREKMPYTTRSLLQTARFSNRHENNYSIINEPCALCIEHEQPRTHEKRVGKKSWNHFVAFVFPWLHFNCRAHHKRSADWRE